MSSCKATNAKAERARDEAHALMTASLLPRDGETMEAAAARLATEPTPLPYGTSMDERRAQVRDGSRRVYETVRLVQRALGQSGETVLEAALRVVRERDEARARVDHWVRAAAEARAALDGIVDLLVSEGCSCECQHHPEDHEDTCERCFACRVGDHVSTRLLERLREAGGEP